MSDEKLTLDDILNDDTFGILDIRDTTAKVKTDEDRLIEEFEEINVFVDKNNREPSSVSMSEFQLQARLKKMCSDEDVRKTLKPFDRHNLLGHVELDPPTLDDVFNDPSGILDMPGDLSIFQYRHIPEGERAKTDFVARRKTLGNEEFAVYEKMFQKVHQEIKDGKRRIIEFKDVDKQLDVGGFYFIDGVMIYLEEAEIGRSGDDLSVNTVKRKDGRTRTIFENGSVSNMYYRSVSKAIYNGGRKMVSKLNETQQVDFNTKDDSTDDDSTSGCI